MIEFELKKIFEGNKLKYFILLILTDGVIDDMQ